MVADACQTCKFRRTLPSELVTGLALQVGLDTKAVLEAWNAIQKKHPELPVFIVTADQSMWLLSALLCIMYVGLHISQFFQL